MTTTEITNSSKKVIQDVLQKLQMYGFWTIILLGIGIFVGITYTNKSKANDIRHSITLGGFISDGKVYDIKLRPVQ